MPKSRSLKSSKSHVIAAELASSSRYEEVRACILHPWLSPLFSHCPSLSFSLFIYSFPLLLPITRPLPVFVSEEKKGNFDKCLRADPNIHSNCGGSFHPSWGTQVSHHSATRVLTFINSNSSMNKWLQPPWNVGGNYLSIPKLQRLHRWSLGMDK